MSEHGYPSEAKAGDYYILGHSWMGRGPFMLYLGQEMGLSLYRLLST